MKSLSSIQVAFLVIFLLSAMGCKKETSTVPAALQIEQPWEMVGVAEAGFNASMVNEAISRADSIPRMLSLLVVKDGKLAVEEYFNGNYKDSVNDTRSVTKSIVSTLVGLALEKGFLSDLEETIGDYLHPAIVEIPAEKRDITIRDLLTMSSGLFWNEFTGNSYNEWILSGDHIGYVIDLPLVFEPGTSFMYNSGACHLLGIILEVATGMELEVFAEQYLFSRIGIEGVRWENLPGGYVNGGAGLDLRPRDLARVGQLFLQLGQSGHEQVISQAWVNEAIKPVFSIPWTYGPLQSVSYSHLWWVEETDPFPAYMAWGYGGQFIYVVPTVDLVVVTTTNYQNLHEEGGPRPLTEAVLGIIVDQILAAIDR